MANQSESVAKMMCAAYWRGMITGRGLPADEGFIEEKMNEEWEEWIGAARVALSMGTRESKKGKQNAE